MGRPLRIEFPGAICHISSRGNRCEPIFVDDVDRDVLLSVMAMGLSRFDAQGLAYCLMGKYYHFVLHMRLANLSLPMRHLNGVYTQASNRRHAKVGHLVPKPIQGDSGRPRCLLAGSVSVCRAEPGARPHGRCAGTVAMVELLRACGAGADAGMAGY